MARVGQTVDAAANGVKTVAGAVVDAGDRVAGGVVGGVTGAIRGATEGLGLDRRDASTAAVVAAGVGAGVLGLVEWPLIALVGGTAYVVKRLNGAEPERPLGQPVARRTTSTGRTRRSA